MRTLARAAAAVVIVAVIGFVLARSSRGGGDGSGGPPPALSNHAATTSFRVSYPANWHRLSASPAGLLPPLSDPLALAPTGTGRELVIGTEPGGGSSAGQLPAVLRAKVASAPDPQIVSLGGQRFSRYLDLAPRGQGVTESLYVLATTRGTIGAVCAAQTPSQSFTATCERVLATLRLTSGRVLAPRVDAGYALALNAVVSKLNGARRALGPKLSTGSMPSRARAAQQLATAHAEAAASTARLSPHAAGLVAANRALGSALGETAAAYGGLGRAITDRRQAAYRSAEAHIGAGARALEAAYARLRGLGYRTS
jgi:hypothetical protein